MTGAASVWPARCERLLPAGPAALLQPAAAGAVSAVPAPAEVPAAAGEHSPGPQASVLRCLPGPFKTFLFSVGKMEVLRKGRTI